ncbi:MAG: choice-of-anchor Q domain-containing protein [Pyrinomonadaceae bacterium]
MNEASDALDIAPGDGICADSVGNCTLRAAIMEANATSARDTIDFAVDLASTITLSRGTLSIINPLTISGPGARNLTIQRNTSPNGALFVLFDIRTQTSISGVTLKNGYGSTGGAIRAFDAIFLTEVAITGNQARVGAGVYLGDVQAFSFSVIDRCLFNGNVVTGQGGAIYTSPDVWLIVRSSTLTENKAQQAGAIANNGWTVLVNSTIYRNSARVWSQLVNPPGSKLELVNNIVGSDRDRSGGAISGTIGSLGGNLITNPVGSTGWSSSDLLGESDPHLGGLSNNGGPTDSIAPLFGSRAINAGQNCVTSLIGCSGLSEYSVRFDQRGFQRAIGQVDIGAIEVEPSTNIANANTATILKPLFR